MLSARIAAALLAMVISLALMNAARAESAVIAEIPYRYDYDGWITVSAQVNSQGPYDFIVDSGATLTVVFSNLAASNDFEPVDEEPKRILGLIETSTLPARKIGDIAVDGQMLSDLTSVVIEDWPAPRRTPQGVLGLDFLSRYVVEIDPAASILRLYSPGRPELTRERGWSSARLTPRRFTEAERPLYTVTARIGRERFPMIVDLGASGTLFNYAALADIIRGGRRGPTTNRNRRPSVQDLFGNERASALAIIDRLQVGRKSWRDIVVNVYDAEIFNELGVGEKPFGLLGADLLRGRAVVLDFEGERLYFGPE